MAGAERIEGCLFGNGERTGNVDLVNIALNLYTQGVSPGLDFSDIDEIAALRRALQPAAGAPAPSVRRRPGLHRRSRARTRTRSRRRFAARRDGDVWDVPYLPIDPKDLGRSYDAVIRVNSQSGKGGIAYLLEQRVRPRAAAAAADRIQPRGAGGDRRHRQGSDAPPDRAPSSMREYGLAAPSVAQPVDERELSDGVVNVRAERARQPTVAAAPSSGAGNGPIDAFVTALQVARRRADSRARLPRARYHRQRRRQRGLPTSSCASAMHTLFGVGVDREHRHRVASRRSCPGLRRAQARAARATARRRSRLTSHRPRGDHRWPTS